MSIDIKGRIKFLEDKGLEDLLRVTSLHFEGQNELSPAVFGNLSKEFKQSDGSNRSF
jgi:hypothetical protein